MTGALAAQLAFWFGLPALLRWAEARQRWVAAVSPVVLCYVLGIGVAQLPGLAFDPRLGEAVIAGTVLLAIPLLLFPARPDAWLRLGRPLLRAWALAVAAVCLSATIAALFWPQPLAERADISGMLVGVYTGGSPNLNAVALARGVSRDTFLLVNAADVLLGSVYFLFLMTVARPLLARLLPAFVPDPAAAGRDEGAAPAGSRIGTAVAVLLALGLAAAAAGLSQLWLGRLSEPFVILGLSTLAIGASWLPRVRRLRGSHEAGQYLLLVFCVAIGTQADLASLRGAAGGVLAYCTLVLLGTVCLHVLAAVVLRIDLDTVLIVSTATIFGPPFVGPIARVLNNRELVPGGIALGVLGLALGTYLGYALAAALAGVVHS